MSALIRLRNELKAATDLAASLMAKAEEEKRELTAEEREKVDAHLAKARDLKAQVSRAKDLEDLQAEMRGMVEEAAPSTEPGAGAARGGSWGVQFVSSVAMEFIRAGHARGAAWVTPAVDLLAATLTEDPASGGKLLVPQYQPGIVAPTIAPPTVVDLLAQGSTDAATISYMVEKTFTNGADAVAEGADKPESALTFDAVTDAVKKIATWLPVTEEMLADVAQIRAYIDARLRQFVELALEKEVISGSGIGAHLLGIVNRPGLAPAVAAGTGELNALAIYRQIVEIMATSLLMPDAVVMSPRAWGATVVAQNAQGVFYGPGMFAGIPSPSLWGLRVSLSQNLPAETTSLVGAFKQGGQLWRRDGVTVQASNSHADFFVKNLVAIRAEQRAALAVYRPGAFGLVTGLTLTTPAPIGGGASAPPLIENGGNGHAAPATKGKR